jgi:hypothetical protein
MMREIMNAKMSTTIRKSQSNKTTIKQEENSIKKQKVIIQNQNDNKTAINNLNQQETVKYLYHQ